MNSTEFLGKKLFQEQTVSIPDGSEENGIKSKWLQEKTLMKKNFKASYQHRRKKFMRK